MLHFWPFVPGIISVIIIIFFSETVYHSNSVLSALSSSWSSKPPLAIRYQLDTGTLEESSVGKSHGSTLDRLFAWEKKLYEEVKVKSSFENIFTSTRFNFYFKSSN